LHDSFGKRNGEGGGGGAGEKPLAKEICRCRGVFEEGKEDVMMTVWNPRRIQGAVGDGGRQWRWRLAEKSIKKKKRKTN
jgi:hypothetical protein